MRRLVFVCVIAVAGGLAEWGAASAPETSLRPVARPGPPQATVSPPATPEVARSTPAPAATRPVARPTTQADRPRETARPSGRDRGDDRPERVAVQRSGERPGERAGERGGIFKSLRPLLRPRAVGKKAIARQNELARGAVCGDVAIQGSVVGRVPGRIAGCGVENAVKVRAVSGVALSMQSVMDCTTAKTLKNWVDRGMKPAVGSYGGGVKSIRVVAHYACRTRNNQRGAKISEHGKGRAIDIAGFTLNDGSTITLLTDWGKGRKGQILRRMQNSACGPFGTVLGPESNKYHLDHFHFDTARYRSGSYCR